MPSGPRLEHEYAAYIGPQQNNYGFEQNINRFPQGFNGHSARPHPNLGDSVGLGFGTNLESRYYDNIATSSHGGHAFGSGMRDEHADGSRLMTESMPTSPRTFFGGLAEGSGVADGRCVSESMPTSPRGGRAQFIGHHRSNAAFGGGRRL